MYEWKIHTEQLYRAGYQRHHGTGCQAQGHYGKVHVAPPSVIKAHLQTGDDSRKQGDQARCCDVTVYALAINCSSLD